MAIAKKELPCIISGIYDMSLHKNNFIDILEKEMPVIVDRFWKALKRRNIKKLYIISDKIVGMYPYTGSMSVAIVNDPISVFKRVAGQPWEIFSHERIGMPDFYGVFDDIENGSAVAYVVDIKSGKWISAFVLRVCVYGKKYGMGMERRYASAYRMKYVWSNSTELIAPDVDAVSMTKFLEGILSSAGLYDYDKCKTPREYSGYSDVSLDRYSFITYKKKK